MPKVFAPLFAFTQAPEWEKPEGTVGPRPEILEEEGVGDKDTPSPSQGQNVHVPGKAGTSLDSQNTGAESH